jgi:hypothetical protein
MAISAYIGTSHALYGREAATQATHRALEQVGRNPVFLGIVISSYHHPIQQVLSGVSALVGDTPLIGFGTSAEITSEGVTHHSTIVILLSGENITAMADWLPGFGEDSRGVTQRMANSLQLFRSEGSLLLIADGFNGDAKQVCDTLPAGDYKIAGCLAGGDLHQARTYQIGGRQSGTNGLAAALLSGNHAMGVGAAHGWQSFGAYFKVTSASGPWVRTLDGRRVSEIYSELFNYPVRDWAFPPLNEIVRLYPLGLESKGQDSMMIRSPLRMESDGSLRMNTSIPEGSSVHILIGSISNCLEAAKNATRQALQDLGKARPVLALVMPDISWQKLFQATPGLEIQAVLEILGADVPIVGGYTFGQIGNPSVDNERKIPELLNQHFEIILFGDKE